MQTAGRQAGIVRRAKSAAIEHDETVILERLPEHAVAGEQYQAVRQSGLIVMPQHGYHNDIGLTNC